MFTYHEDNLSLMNKYKLRSPLSFIGPMLPSGYMRCMKTIPKESNGPKVENKSLRLAYMFTKLFQYLNKNTLEYDLNFVF